MVDLINIHDRGLLVGSPGDTQRVAPGCQFKVEKEEADRLIKLGKAAKAPVEGEFEDAPTTGDEANAKNIGNADAENSDANGESSEVAESGEQVSDNDAESTGKGDEGVAGNEGEGEATVETAESLTALTNDALKALITERGLTFEGNPKKADLVNILLKGNGE